jgi:eukaryotic-like serine/threonine-protein kinase
MSVGPGSRLDAYEIIRPIGSGGMGEVWLATETRLGRHVALKVLPADLTRDASRVRRFEQEARAASALNHPNVCTIFALGETNDGERYIAMEYVEGETLRRRLTTSRPSLREAIDIAIQVAAALSVAHAAGIAHRDIKPENVMLRPDGVVKVLDFGLAKLAPLAPEGTDTTRLDVHTDAGTVVGTAAYMSPEQARGQQVDARTDIWSLGVLLYELVAGRSPFAAPSGSDVLAAILQNDPAPVARFEPDAPAEVQRILTKTLRKDRSQRYQTVQDLLLDLQALRENLLSNARPASGPIAQFTPEGVTGGSSQTVPSVPRSRRDVWLAVAAAVLVLGTVLGVWAWKTARGRLMPTAPTSAVVQRPLARLTFGSGLQTDPTFSPDGRFVAYASDRSENFDIWVQPVAGGDAVQITRSPAQDTQPDWSPDGASIVFRSDRQGGGLFVMPALGGSERRLSTFGAHPRWSRDGSEILFVVESQPDENGLMGLAAYTVAVKGGEPQPVLADFLRDGLWFSASLHPDGRISVAGIHRQRRLGFFTVSRDSKKVQSSNRRAGLPELYFMRFVWNASGTVLYGEGWSGGVRNLWRIGVDPQTLEWTTVERLTTGPGGDATAQLSRDGTRVVFTVLSESTRIWLYPFNAETGRVLGEGKPVTPEQSVAENLVLSRDGRLLQYRLREIGSSGYKLRIENLDDHTVETVVVDRGTDPWPGCWSRDGRSFVYNVWDYDQDARGSSTLRLATRGAGNREIGPWSDKYVFHPTDWTPDGTRILGSYYNPPLNADHPVWLALWPTAGSSESTPRQVLIQDPDLRIWQSSYSPDGRWIAFVSEYLNRPDALDMMVMPASGAPRQFWVRVAGAFPKADKPRWAPDGRTIYFVARHSSYSGYNVWGVRFDSARGIPGTEPFRVTSFDSMTLAIDPRMTVTETGVSSNRLVLPMMSVTGNIWMLDNVDK